MKYSLLRIGSLLLLCVHCLLVSAQEPIHFNYTVEDGLPSSEVYDVHQDQQGYIWFATDHGLCRYNGYEFHTFTKKDGLTDNSIFDIREDQNGVLWLTTFQGGISYCDDGKCGAHPENEKILKLLGRNYPDNIVIDSSGVFYISSRLSNIISQEVIQVDSDGVSIHPTKKRFTKEVDEYYTADEFFEITDQIEKGLVLSESGRSFLTLQNKDRLFYTGDTLLCFKAGTKELISQGIYTYIYSIFEDKAQNRWISMNTKGVYFYKQGTSIESTPSLFFKGKTITDIIEDLEGNIWLTTLRNGVIMIPSVEMPTYDGRSGIKDTKILTLALDDSEQYLYFSSFNSNLYRIDSTLQMELLFATSNMLPVFAIHPDKEGNVYLGNGFKLSPKMEAGLVVQAAQNTRIILPRKNGDLLYGRSVGINTFRNGQFINEPVFNEPMLKYVFTLCEDDQEQLWIGGLSGLYKNIGDSLYYMGDENPLFKSRIQKIVEHRNGALFLATKGVGLLIYTPDSTYQLTETDGLNSNLLRSLYIENDTTLWVAGNKGLNRVHFNFSDQLSIQGIDAYRRSDGLPSEEINEIRGAFGQIWLATNRGLTRFDSRTLQVNEKPPIICLTKWKINGKEMDWSQKLDLSYAQNDMDIQFLGLNYRDVPGIRYRYRLLGYDEKWKETEVREVKYTNLPPGNYTFLLTARHQNSTWNVNAQKIRFSIGPHFSQTWWFICGSVLVGLLLLFFLMKILLQRQRNKEQLMRQIVESEQKALRAQINPHFIFNAMNSIQYFITDNDKKNASVYLSRFSNLMRKTLEDSRKNLITLEEELDSLRHYLELERLRFTDKFTYDFEIDEAIDLYETEIPPMMIQPFLENAIWHGLMPLHVPGRLSIHFKKSKKAIICIIRDNGIGREQSELLKKDKRKASTGIKNTLERIQVINTQFKSDMNLTITDIPPPNAGTEVLITFPVFR